jgi:hypothetical protein
MLNMKLICVVAVAVLSSGIPACAQSPRTGDGRGAEPVKSSTSEFVVGPREVRLPLGVFLLIRKGGKIGAIRFTSIEPGSTSGIGKASYESYFQSDGSGSFRAPSVRKRTGENNLKPLKGIGRLGFQLGNDKVKVGDWMFATGDPGALDMWPYRGEEKDHGYEFAPTSARSVEDIDPSDKRLKWFRYDADKSITLLVSELPK